MANAKCHEYLFNQHIHYIAVASFGWFGFDGYLSLSCIRTNPSDWQPQLIVTAFQLALLLSPKTGSHISTPLKK
jgi:hypothetical protein